MATTPQVATKPSLPVRVTLPSGNKLNDRATKVKSRLLSMRVPFYFVMGSVKETSTVFIDYTKQFFQYQRHKTCTMLQLIDK